MLLAGLCLYFPRSSKADKTYSPPSLPRRNPTKSRAVIPSLHRRTSSCVSLRSNEQLLRVLVLVAAIRLYYSVSNLTASTTKNATAAAADDGALLSDDPIRC